MTDILTYIVYGTIGAFIALIIKESFTWKGQGRTEAIKRYETLLIDCYGVLLPLTGKLTFHRENIMIQKEIRDQMDLVYHKFSFRIPNNIERRLFSLIFSSEPFDKQFYRLPLKNEKEAKLLVKTLQLCIRSLTVDIKMELEKLESYTQSFGSRLNYVFRVWNFHNKELLN